MNYEEKYKAALGWMQGLYNGLHGKTKEEAEKFFPELAESEDERIRKAILSGLKYLETELGFDAVGNVDILDAYAWLEKQVSIDEEKMLIGARKDVASSIIAYIDRNTLGMCLSNMECEDLVNAVVDSDWGKVYNHMKKKLEQQGKQNYKIIKGKNYLCVKTHNYAGVEWIKGIKYYIKDIVDRLKCAVNGVTITPEEAKEMLDCIIKN